MSKGATKPAVLSLVEPFAEAYLPKSLDSRLPRLLSDMFDKKNLKVPFTDLVASAEAAMEFYQCSVSEIHTGCRRTDQGPG